MMKVLIPGSFDPPTNGHIDVISRCAKVFDEVLVGVVVNPSKKSLLSTETRELMLNEIFSETGNIVIKTFKGLLVDFAKDNDVKAIVKGLRAMTDFDYEFQMAQMNSNLADFETIFIPASPEYGYVSSSMVKEIDSYGGDISKLVPKNVFKRMQDDR
ncbi:MAG: pantetheine-phosphate adenylyltransferase [Acidimicrobiaceae bacterium TMED189]|nr:MAG: pantetheine-phosphate adenylyltransferase [Acidimicrobiaceae bacterium TMED189]